MDDFSYFPLNNPIKLIRITKEKYDFLKATPDSRFNIYFNIDSEVFCELKSTQENCDNLKTIFMNISNPIYNHNSTAHSKDNLFFPHNF